MKKAGGLFASVLVLSVAGGLTGTTSHGAGPVQTPKSWPQKMRSLEKVLQDLLIDLNSDERYNDPKNFKRIEAGAEKLSKLARELKLKDGASPDGDPTIPIIADQFAKESAHAYRTLSWGHRAYARGVLKSMTGYCMACHTRNASGPSFQVSITPAVEALKPLEKADYFASTRAFDRALDEYEKISADPSILEKRPLEWERSVRSGLAVAVRVKKDPDRALTLVNRVLTTPRAPYFLKEQAAQWKLSLDAWKAEPAQKAQTEQGYYSQAIKLVGEARALQKYPADRGADIQYLRASAAVHDLLSFAPNGEYVADGLYLAGLCYEVLHDLNLWDQHEFYYLACMFKSPHSEKAMTCFNHYEQSVYQGYTGSSGMNLPGEVVDKLRELEKLSLPVEVPKKLQ